MDRYLAATDIVDYGCREIAKLAMDLSAGCTSNVDTAKRCFEWVRDNVDHSSDSQRNPVTCEASNVLNHRVGMCYAKSHLLAALLRANGIPAAFCYQRLKLDDAGTSWCLHGLNAIYLDSIGWYRVDARGNKPGVNAQFDPPIEALAFLADGDAVQDMEGLFAEPLPVVLEALRAHSDVASLMDHLPDLRQN